MFRIVCLLLFVSLTSAWQSHFAVGQTLDTAESLQLSVRRLDAWLGTGPKAEGWRRALWLAALETQAARGYGADPQWLNQILVRFDSGYEGLSHPNFQDTRRQLAAHLQRLQLVSIASLNDQISAAREGYRPLKESDVVAVRSELMEALGGMKEHYDRNADADRRKKVWETTNFEAFEKELQELKIAELIPPAKKPGEAIPPAVTEEAGDDAGKSGDSGLLPSEDDSSEADRKEVDAQEKAQAEKAQEGERELARARNAERTRVLRSLLKHSRDFEAASNDNPDIWLLSATVACERFVRVLEAASSTQTETNFQTWLNTLEQDLPRLSDPQERRAAIRVGEALGKLTHALQAQALVAAIRRQHAQPNLQLEVSASLISSFVNRGQSDRLPVDEQILGRQIYGTANTRNDVQLELLDDPHQVSASIHLRGRIHSDTYTKEGPITAFTGSNGEFEGRRNLYANIGGFYATDPYVSANLQSYFKGVDCRLRLVQRIATKQYGQSKYDAEGISASRVETRVDRQFSEQTDEALGNARPRLAERHPQLFAVGRWIPELAMTSSRTAISVLGSKVDPARLGAASPPPSARSAADIRIQLHQSSAANFVEPLIAGQQFTNKELGELFERLTGEVPESFQEKEDEEPWSIFFPAAGALSVAFEDQKLKLEITGARFSQADRQINAPLIIGLQFELVRRDGEIYLVQTAPPKLEYGEGADKNARVVSFKSFLEGKLEDGFKANQAGTALPANLIPVERLEDSQIRDFADDLQLAEFRIENGWLTAAWNRVTSSGQYQVADLPAIRSLAIADNSAADQSKTPEKPADATTEKKDAEEKAGAAESQDAAPPKPSEATEPPLDGSPSTAGQKF